MKRTIFSTFIILTVGITTLSIFQNCSPSHEGGSTTAAFSIASVYPYMTGSAPVYFDNVQLTEAAKVGSNYEYSFVAGVVYIDDPGRDIDIEINIYDDEDKILCLSKTARINSSNNHVMIDNCTSTREVDTIKITVKAKLATESGSPLPVNSYTFTL